MNYKLGVLVLVALQACYSAALAPCVCGRNLNEVCGSDGETYSNVCKLNCEIHMGKKDLTVASEGPCPPDALPLCICTMEYKPVCGNDGNTYPNRCAMECTRSKNPNIEIANEGQCVDKVKVADNLPIPPPCICTRDNKPVCGSDGITYNNDCLLNCATANDNTLSIAHAGKCETVKVVDNLPIPPPCICTRDNKPVCGSDGITYNNDCLLNCATANDSTLSISHSGECGKVNIVDNAPSKSCTCTRNLKPVCGSDGVTYNNLCLLECAGQSVTKQGPC